MRIWLFFKEKSTPSGTAIEFRRVENGTVMDYCMPELLLGATPVPEGQYVDVFAASLVRRSKWVGGAAHNADSDIGKAILKGRW